MQKSPASKPPLRFYGILGLITLSEGLYLFLIESRVHIGTFDGHKIYGIGSTKLIKISSQIFAERDYNIAGNEESSLDEERNGEKPKKEDRVLIKILNRLLKTKGFYFSYTMDLSNSLQRKYMQSSTKNPLWLRYDDRFFSNRIIMDKFISDGLDEWIIPVIQGNLQVFFLVIHGSPFDFLLISRRSRFRNGTRYRTRGVDLSGRVANYVEIEQIININGSWFSFVQTRGSIPLLWNQTGKRYTPVPRVSMDFEKNTKLFTKHFEIEIKIYNSITVLSLLDQKGVESELATLYKEYCSKLKKIEYLELDFHSYPLKKIASAIIQSTKKSIDQIGFFHLDHTGNAFRLQKGVIRTNCLDCLDRTNFTQTIIAKYVFKNILDGFPTLTGNRISESVILNKIFNESWVISGDFISYQYAGTGALKTDFTKTGKQRTRGKVKDGVNSISRYYINNFRYTLKQISIDLFYGTYEKQSKNDIINKSNKSDQDKFNLSDCDLGNYYEECDSLSDIFENGIFNNEQSKSFKNCDNHFMEDSENSSDNDLPISKLSPPASLDNSNSGSEDD